MAKDLVLKKLEEHDEKFDRVIKKLLDHDNEFVKIREEIKESRNEVLSVLDGIAKGIKDLNQEKTFNFATTQRIQEVIDEHTKEICDIKKVLKIA